MITILLSSGRERLRLPVLPEQISVSNESPVNRYQMQALGEIALPGKRKLRTLSLSSYFPARADGNTGNLLPLKPSLAAEILERWCYETTVVQVAVSGGALSINMPMLVEAFTPKMGKQAEEIAYDLELVEYRDLRARKAASTTYILPGGAVAKLEVPAPTTAKTTTGGDSRTDVGKIGAYRQSISAIGGIQAGPASKAVAAARTAKEAAAAKANKKPAKPPAKYINSKATVKATFSPTTLATKYPKKIALAK